MDNHAVLELVVPKREVVLEHLATVYQPLPLDGHVHLRRHGLLKVSDAQVEGNPQLTALSADALDGERDLGRRGRRGGHHSTGSLPRASFAGGLIRTAFEVRLPALHLPTARCITGSRHARFLPLRVILQQATDSSSVTCNSNLSFLVGGGQIGTKPAKVGHSVPGAIQCAKVRARWRRFTKRSS